MAEKVTTQSKMVPTAKGKDMALQQEAKKYMFDADKYNRLSANETRIQGYSPSYQRKSEEELRALSQNSELMDVQNRSELSRINRERDMLRGQQRGREMFGDGSLGSVDTNRSKDMQEIIANRQNIMREGLGADVFQAGREARLNGLGRAEQMAARQLRAGQAAGGIQGPLAGAQQMALMNQQQNTRQGAERQLLLDNAQARLQGLGAAESSIKGAQADELGRQQFNIGQTGREKLAQSTIMMGEAALGASERGAAIQGEAAKAYAQSAANQGGGKK